MNRFFVLSFFLLILFTSDIYAEECKVDCQKYRLGSGDKLKINVFNEPELSGEFEIDGSGILAFPLIGSIEAGGFTPRDLEKIIVEKLSGDYLINPKVSIEVLNFRPFFILGEVKNPGSYPYVSGLTIINAIALAGGYTYRAYTKSINVIRGKGEDRKELKANEDDLVMPGDSIIVEERLF